MQFVLSYDHDWFVTYAFVFSWRNSAEVEPESKNEDKLEENERRSKQRTADLTIAGKALIDKLSAIPPTITVDKMTMGQLRRREGRYT